MGQSFKLIPLAFLIIISISGFSQDTIRYQVTFTNAIHHECLISIVLWDVPSEPLTFKMSSSSPGRYANHEFAKNVYGIKAISVDDNELDVERTDHSEWKVTPENGYLKLYYTLYANHADGTYSGIDREYALFNIPSSFMWIEGMRDKPIRVDFDFHSNRNWQVATQLKQLSSSGFYAPNLEYLMDSPTVLAEFDLREFVIDDQGKARTIRVVFNPDANKIAEDRFTELVKKTVHEQMAIFGELPDFDFGQYTFLCSFDPPFITDAMEHRNSTMVTSSHPLDGNEVNLMGAISHEFFHSWNAERLRPRSLEPFDFTTVNQSEELWFVEGFTEYYGDLTLLRTDIISNENYFNKLTRVLNYVLSSPGTKKHSLIQMSQMAPFTDASSFIDETNFQNIWTNYYFYGEAIAFALDLSLRTQFDNLSLDDYMELMWRDFGRKEIPYTQLDLRSSLAKLTGDVAFANHFFDMYIMGTEVPKFDLLFEKMGYELKIGDTTATDLNKNEFEIDDKKLYYQVQPLERSTFYVAGLNQGDEIISMNKEAFHSLEELEAFFSGLSIGDVIRIKFKHHGRSYEDITLVKPRRSYVIHDLANDSGRLTEQQKALRKDWMKSKTRK